MPPYSTFIRFVYILSPIAQFIFLYGSLSLVLVSASAKNPFAANTKMIYTVFCDSLCMAKKEIWHDSLAHLL